MKCNLLILLLIITVLILKTMYGAVGMTKSTNKSYSQYKTQDC